MCVDFLTLYCLKGFKWNFMQIHVSCVRIITFKAYMHTELAEQNSMLIYKKHTWGKSLKYISQSQSFKCVECTLQNDYLTFEYL